MAESADQVDVNLHGRGEADRLAAAGRRLLLGGQARGVRRSITQANIFGTGKFLGVQVNSGNGQPDLLAVVPRPVLHRRRREPGLRRLQAARSTPPPLAIGAYTTDTRRRLQVRLPVERNRHGQLRHRRREREARPVRRDLATPVRSYINFVEHSATSTPTAAARSGWARDTARQPHPAHRGTLTRAAVELAAGDLQYYRLSASEQFYYPLSRTVTLALNGEVGYADGYGGKPLPFFKNFYAGGPARCAATRPSRSGRQDPQGNVARRQPARSSAAPKSCSRCQAPQQDKSLRLAAFIDGGQVLSGPTARNRIGRRTALLRGRRPRVEFPVRSAEDLLCLAAQRKPALTAVSGYNSTSALLSERRKSAPHLCIAKS